MPTTPVRVIRLAEGWPTADLPLPVVLTDPTPYAAQHPHDPYDGHVATVPTAAEWAL